MRFLLGSDKSDIGRIITKLLSLESDRFFFTIFHLYKFSMQLFLLKILVFLASFLLFQIEVILGKLMPPGFLGGASGLGHFRGILSEPSFTGVRAHSYCKSLFQYSTIIQMVTEDARRFLNFTSY